MTEYSFTPGIDDMADEPPRKEKKTCTLPPIRISEALEVELMRMAMQSDRKYSDFIRLILHRHVYGHGAASLGVAPDGNNQ